MKAVIKPDEQAPIAAEIIAKAIIDISEAMKRFSTSGLKRNAIVVLIHDRSGIGKRDIEVVLNNLEALRADWCTK